MMNGKKIWVLSAVVSAVMFSGCSELIAIGSTQTYCDEHCANYEDAGVCATPYEIYQNRHSYAQKAAFTNKHCRTCK